ncbi:hypothetical protein IG631_09256 [Alternaria alternata]|nr:hypothetical protein IG631_09256 [Alternaria alternata]
MLTKVETLIMSAALGTCAFFQSPVLTHICKTFLSARPRKLRPTQTPNFIGLTVRILLAASLPMAQRAPSETRMDHKIQATNFVACQFLRAEF